MVKFGLPLKHTLIMRYNIDKKPGWSVRFQKGDTQVWANTGLKKNGLNPRSKKKKV